MLDWQISIFKTSKNSMFEIHCQQAKTSNSCGLNVSNEWIMTTKPVRFENNSNDRTSPDYQVTKTQLIEYMLSLLWDFGTKIPVYERTGSTGKISGRLIISCIDKKMKTV